MVKAYPSHSYPPHPPQPQVSTPSTRYASTPGLLQGIGQTDPAGSIKYDAGKPRVDLIPGAALLALGEIFRFGAGKYAEHNWKGLDPERLRRAALGHLYLHEAGELHDPESSMLHVAHAATSALMYLYLILQDHPLVGPPQADE